MSDNYRIEVMESERGWGQNYEYINHVTREEALANFHEINAWNTGLDVVPDHYILALDIEKRDEETGRWFKIYP